MNKIDNLIFDLKKRNNTLDEIKTESSDFKFSSLVQEISKTQNDITSSLNELEESTNKIIKTTNELIEITNKIISKSKE